jgi:hypothetical protein
MTESLEKEIKRIRENSKSALADVLGKRPREPRVNNPTRDVSETGMRKIAKDLERFIGIRLRVNEEEDLDK